MMTIHPIQTAGTARPMLLATLVMASIALLWHSAGAAAKPIQVDLRGLGAISSTTDADGAMVFACDSTQHADWLLSKLQADLTWDANLGIRQIKLPGGQPALALDGSGLLVLARHGARVYAISGLTPEVLAAGLKRLGLGGAGTSFNPVQQRPMSLDFFDLRPISIYYLPLNVLDLAKGWMRYDRSVLSQAADFFARFHFGYSMFGPYFGFDETVDGAENLFPLDYSAAQARAHHSVFMTHLGDYWAPWWMRNRFPHDIIQWDPNVITGWGSIGAMAGTYLSGDASNEAYAYSHQFTSTALKELEKAAGPNLGCYRVAGGGHPGDEMGFHNESTEYMDYDDASQQAFRQWLRDDRHLSLQALGQRWYGDPTHYKSWGQVQIPSNMEFFGAYGRDTFNLLTGWLWRPDSPNAEAEDWQATSYKPGDEWTPTDLAPSLQQLFLFGSSQDKKLRQGSSRVAWFRKEFDPTAWLAAHAGSQVYVVAQVGDTRTEPVEVWLNDAYLGLIKPETVWAGPIAFKATGLIRRGPNVLCLKVQNGVIRGPVFLTTQEPRRYPYLGPLENARWVDLRDWSAHKLVSGWTREAQSTRGILPDIPLLFCCGGSREYADHFLDLRRKVGIACLHFTGGGSSYMPWWAGYGYVWGGYMTSEEGGTITDPAGLSRELAWMLLDCNGHHNYYYSAVDYMRIEQKTHWFSSNARLLDLCGKATWKKPQVAVLRAARSDLYFPYSASADDWDIGRSSIQATHVQNVYVSEAEVEAGLADDYPVLWDAGTSVMDDRLLSAIGRYVRAGGTFVAVSDTGEHSLLQPDTWPIEKLTGFKVMDARENDMVTVLPGNPLLKRLAGLTFNGTGIAVNWMGQNHLANGSVALAPQDGDGVALARWADGSVAVGMRRLGKGRVIVLGSSFWRSMSDRAGSGVSLNGTVQTTFLNDIFAGLGVRKRADINSEDVWLRSMTTKNGLQDWVMAWNSGRGPLSNLTLTFHCAIRPAHVLNVVTGQPAPFTWENGSVRVTGLNFDVNDLKVFGVDRPGFIPALQHWLTGREKWEPASPPAPRPTIAPPPPPATVVMDNFRFRPAGAIAKTDSSWLKEPLTGVPWKKTGYGFWDEQGYPAKGVGLYRESFQAPAAWTGHRVLLACVSWDYPVFLENATFYLNGQYVGDYQGHPWSNFDVLDITRYLRPGENDLGVLVEASEVRGGYLGQLVAYPLDNLQDAMDLKAGWKLFSDNQNSTPAQVPLEASGRFLQTDVNVPANWPADKIELEFEVSDKWVGCVVVNGRAISYNGFMHPYPNMMQINLYPFIKPGQVNRIELWPRDPETMATAPMGVKNVRIGVVK